MIEHTQRHRNLFELSGKTAIVTGASSGIGQAIAVSLARRGCNLALADINDAGLQETVASLAAGIYVTQHHLDVGNRDAVAAFPEVVRAVHGGASLLFNNAGVALSGRFDQVSEEEFDWLLNINLGGVVRMTRAFLPMLREETEARLVNLSSLFGLIAPPGQAAYCASKFAVRGFSESLRQELRGSTIGVTVVHPGGVATSIAKNARIGAQVPRADLERQSKYFERALRLSPKVAGETIVRGVERRRVRIIVGADAKLAALLERLRPVSYWKLLERLAAPGGNSAR